MSSMKKRHNSQRERAWIQDMSSILLKLYHGKPPDSKPKNLWREKPDHWPSNKPFYDTKNLPADRSGSFISDNENLVHLIQCCNSKEVHINNKYQKEIIAWTENRHQLLYKLHIFRTETEKIKRFLQNILIYKDTDEIKEALDNINVKLSLKVGDSDLKNILFKRLKSQSEMIADTTRYLAAIVCKIIKGKDPESKCNGIWTTPPEKWPTNVSFFSPSNRGTCKNTCSDHMFVATLLQHPKAVIPPKFQSLVEAYQNVLNAPNKKEANKLKKILCRVKTQLDVAELDCVLTYLHSEGFFTLDVYHCLHQWWTSEPIENQSKISLSNLHKISEEKPKICIEVTTKYLAVSVMQSTIDSPVAYNISFDGNLPSTYGPSSQICLAINRLHNNDEFEKISHNLNLQNQQGQNMDPYAISMNDSNQGYYTTQSASLKSGCNSEFSTLNECLCNRHKQSSGDSQSMSFRGLTQRNETVHSADVKGIPNKGETLSRDSVVSGRYDNNKRAIECDKTESHDFNSIQSKGKKRKYSTVSNEDGKNNEMLVERDIKKKKYTNVYNNKDDSKSKLTESTIKDNSCVCVKTREETVSDNITRTDHQLDDRLLEDCLIDILLQHTSKHKFSKQESCTLSADTEDEIEDITFNDEELEISLTDMTNYESGNTSRLGIELNTSQ